METSFVSEYDNLPEEGMVAIITTEHLSVNSIVRTAQLNSPEYINIWTINDK